MPVMTRLWQRLTGRTGARPADALSPRVQTRLEQIRLAMLAALGGAAAERTHPALARRLRCAADVQGLWYARGELMAALAQRHGERAARAQLHRITAMFEGLLPRSLMAGRPTRRR